ncbi:MAG: 3-hydroxyacyl-ACP dehydratase FabZ [Alphaproteobacteria bacterium]
MSENLDILEIKKLIPHRYPFLMIDKVVDLIANESATGIKNVTINEPFFQGHFPDKPVMPGVLIVEAMAQTAAVVVMIADEIEPEGKLVYFMTVDNCKFRRPVVPGDVLEIKVTKKQQKMSVWKFEGDAQVNGKTVASATFSAMIVDAPNG